MLERAGKERSEEGEKGKKIILGSLFFFSFSFLCVVCVAACSFYNPLKNRNLFFFYLSSNGKHTINASRLKKKNPRWERRSDLYWGVNFYFNFLFLSACILPALFTICHWANRFLLTRGEGRSGENTRWIGSWIPWHREMPFFSGFSSCIHFCTMPALYRTTNFALL